MTFFSFVNRDIRDSFGPLVHVQHGGCTSDDFSRDLGDFQEISVDELSYFLKLKLLFLVYLSVLLLFEKCD